MKNILEIKKSMPDIMEINVNETKIMEETCSEKDWFRNVMLELETKSDKKISGAEAVILGTVKFSLSTAGGEEILEVDLKGKKESEFVLIENKDSLSSFRELSAQGYFHGKDVIVWGLRSRVEKSHKIIIKRDTLIRASNIIIEN